MYTTYFKANYNATHHTYIHTYIHVKKYTFYQHIQSHSYKKIFHTINSDKNNMYWLYFHKRNFCLKS